MSLTGRNAKSIRKQEYKESRNLAQGFTKLVFAHKAALGDSQINLGSLNLPTEMSSLGFSNPSPSRLSEARLFQFKTNLTLISSTKGVLMQDLSYRVNSNASIRFEGFTAEDGEIFIGVIDANPVSGIQVIDAKPQTAIGDLPDGDTDFSIGFTTRTGAEEILVFRNGLIQKRNSSNSSTLLDGNYYIVDSGSGFGSVVRFNSPASGDDDSIIVSSIGSIVESPTNSTWDEIEKVQGQIDALVPTVAALAGVPETDFQNAPNNVDLKAFGTRVIDLESREWNQEDFYREAVIDCTGSGQFLSGSVRVVRVGNVVTLSSAGNVDFTHASATSGFCAAGLLPIWARPSHFVSNVADFNGAWLTRVEVYGVGQFGFSYRDWAGSGSSQTGTNNRQFTISYTV